LFKKIAILNLSLLITLSLSSFTAAFKLPDTGQSACYNSTGALIPCAGTGQDGAYSINPMTYTDNGDGTVKDNNTGLTWLKQNAGSVYNWYEASGTYNASYNPSSLSVCGSVELGGHTDWRLPKKNELMSIVDYSRYYPAINTSYFPNTNAASYWSFTSNTASPDSAWGVDFSDGGIYDGYMFGEGYVRCVRGQQSIQSFIDNGNGTVTDTGTGLMWQQHEQADKSWNNALSYCEGLTLGNHSDWRLPNIREHESVIDDARYDPAIDKSFFPNAYSSYYLSSSTFAGNPGHAWLVSLYDGGIYNFLGKDSIYYVRCVRGGEGGALGRLTTNFSGTGAGTVTGAGLRLGEQIVFSFNTNSSIYLDNGTNAGINASPAEFSLFSGWTGCDYVNGAYCPLTMNAYRTVTATFNFRTGYKSRIGDTASYYSTLQAAYDNAPNPGIVKSWATGFSENLTCAKTKNVTLKGGNNEAYSVNTGYTTLRGKLTIQAGSLTVEKLIIM
jgi:hypothetical protein